ncbi:putative ABC-type ATPase [Sporomusaceae bacterium BoRhaA]|uniref:zeta toxin family protein n=1 Tax=Pelorhabdus rhamnosifermentans TaxID=2772457 RepID=UPI001C0605D8|nr:zeta toxin family protein [Pelorhabdus rhamnosifermentans]MBU2703200.1 putative ABC-type ATPase [Pelorhabdus rhamnosifermentans]
MIQGIIRPLGNNDFVEPFVKGVLQFSEKAKIRRAIEKIVDAEMCITAVEKDSTLKSTKFRDFEYKTDEQRIELRKKILSELISYQRLSNDDCLKLGKGGAKPLTNVISESQAYIITGLPASGKSGIATKIADEYGAYIVDSDYAKRKFPEYNHQYGAHLVHEESKLVTSTEQDFNLLDFCISKGHNLVFPTIGYDAQSLIDYAHMFNAKGYCVHLTLVSLDRKKAVIRAYERFVKTKRYVPLGLIFDQYSNEPILAYYRSKRSTMFKSHGAISTDVKFGQSPIFVEGDDGNPAMLYRE